MRFIFLSAGYYPDQVGGAFRYVTEVTERLAARGHHVTVIFPGDGKQTSSGKSPAGATLHRFPQPRGFFWNNWRQKNISARHCLLAATQVGGEPLLTVLCHAYFEPAFTAHR